jgi:hypothetical protein
MTERGCFGRCLVAKFGSNSLADELKLGKAARAVELIRKSIKANNHIKSEQLERV